MAQPVTGDDIGRNSYVCSIKREREGERGRGREREKRREDNTLLHKGKVLSTIRLFRRSVPDDKHSNTQYIKTRMQLTMRGETT